MAASDDFKKALRSGNLTEAFAIAMGQAVELKISTRIVPSNTDGTSRSDLGRIDPDCRLRTKLNLVEGKIENEVGNRFISGDSSYGEIRRFHIEQVAQGHETIASNIESLQKMFRLMVLFEQQKLGSNTQDIEWLQLEDRDPKPQLESPTPRTAKSNLSEREDARNEHSTRQYSATNGTSNFAVSELDRTSQNGYLQPHLSMNDSEDEDEAIILSLEDLDPDIDNEPKEDDEDWGDWMIEETNTDNSIKTIDLRAIDLKKDDDEDWNRDN
jgi:hypothetical protein